MSLLATLQDNWIETVDEILLPLLSLRLSTVKLALGRDTRLRLLLPELLTVRVEKITLDT
jgi:hypothetical protein